MNFYAVLIILSELLMLTMTLHVVGYSGFTIERKAWYIITFVSIMFCAAAEFAVHCGYYDARFAFPLTVITVLQFSIAPVLGILFIGALGLKNQGRIAAVYFAVNLLVEIISAPNGWIFYFNNEGYFRGESFIVYETFYIVSLIYLLFGLIIVGENFRHRDKYTIAMTILILVAGIVPMTLFRVNITYMAVAIASSLSYIFYNDLVQQDIMEELVDNQKKVSSMQSHIITGMANLIENRDTETGEHVARTSYYVKTLAEDARKDGVYAEALDDHVISLMYTMAPMHDIGKIVVSDSILRKPGKLTAEEFEQMKVHTTAGGEIVREILSGIKDEESITCASDIATYHHEKWDGNGYPKGLKGSDIPLPARIMAIADVYDALVSERCYKKAMEPEEAFDIIREGAGSHFDPKLAKVFLDHRDEFRSKS